MYKAFNYLLGAILLLLNSMVVLSQSFQYLPANVGNNQVIAYTQFTLSYNELHEQPDWVAYELTKAEAEMQRDRNDTFRVDSNILSGSATLSDYRSTGFDRGHLCPAADNNMSFLANKESFFMSNMSPQLPKFNRETWAELEAWVREKAIAYDTVYVVTGPVFVNNLGTIGNNEVRIPGYFYKTLLRFEDNSPKLIAFLLPHVGCVGELKDYIVSVNTIETLTGLDFYPELSSRIENRAESVISPGSWGFD